ncbi:DUF4129 domain-containing transglutaminase family protein [Dehalogenimonas etheniformans]|uniref:DUF4129 domain-containing protein n=1 Tax=Dehalogenimonas etheniformans TaxID=1536648 RepID=A0A2P5P894_9CHLR|nr:transglutaminase domain-containing protein [Dehalogenimonas etheniformans]PPD58518.1 DUF4129 domain-containing protein [Dehalogenimonas etheniformans]QNT76718.1 transglutaminase domain-containing protein [Dehalogenimonas etheniformans]
MTIRSRPNEYIRGISSIGAVLWSAALTAASLGVAVWSLQSAKWFNPNPSFMLVLLSGIALSTFLALTGMKQRLAMPIMVFTGLLVSIWQSMSAMPEVASSSAWSRWLAALAEPARDPAAFVMVLVIVTWLIGSFGAWYAVRRRNGWIAFGLGCILAILNLVNLPRDFSYVLPLFTVLGLALIVQTNWAKFDRKKSSGNRTLQIIPGTLICVAVTLGAFALPQSPAETLDLNIDGGAIYSAIKNNGFNVFEAVPSKVKTILSSTQETVSFGESPDLGDTVRFIITPAMPGYFATRYYDTYSAGGWSNSPLNETSIPANQSLGEAVPPLKAATVHYKVESEVKTDIILVNGRPETLDISTLAKSLPAMSGIDISSLAATKILSAYSSYAVVSQIQVAIVADLLKANSSYPEWITQRYLQLPANLPRSVKTLAQQLTRGIPSSTTGTSTYNKVVAIENYLLNFKYEIDGTLINGNTDGVAAFLAERQGNCVNFASALVVMLRAAGVPARFTQGYLGSEVDADGKNLSIYGRDAHAWAEVYFPDYGWVLAEATPGKPTDNFTGFSSQIPGGTVPPDTDTTPIIGDDPQTPQNPPGTSPYSPSSDFHFSWILWGLLAGLVLTAGGGTIYLTRAPNPQAMYVRLRWLGGLYGEKARPADTPGEYSRRLGLKLTAEATEISAITDAFARSRYGRPGSADIASRDELMDTWKKLSAGLIRGRFFYPK